MLCALLFFLAYVAGLRSPRPGLWIFTAGLLVGLGSGIRLTLAPLGVFNRWTAGLGAFTESVRLIAPDQTTVLRKSEVKFQMKDPGLNATTVTLFGNVEFVRINDLYLQSIHGTITFVRKLGYAGREILLNMPLFTAFVGSTIIAFLHARATDGRLPRELKILFLMFPFLLMGVLAPSPMYRQYFYPLVSFLVLGGVYAVAAVANSKTWWKGSIVICAAGVVVSTIFSMSPYRHLREFGSPGEWEPLQVHDGARHSVQSGLWKRGARFIRN